MLAADDVVYIAFADASAEDGLCLARVVERSGDKLKISFRDRVEAQVGAEAFIHVFDDANRFLRAPVRVARSAPGDLESKMELTLVGEPEPANKRGCFRVRMINDTDRVVIGAEKRFKVNDVSMEGTGFSIAGPDVFVDGQLIEVELDHGGRKARGSAWVRNSGRGPGGRRRFGIEPAEDASALRALLREIAADTVRRKQRNFAAKRG